MIHSFPAIVGIVGLKQSGKSTLADVLRNKLGKEVREYAYAHTLKKGLLHMGVPSQSLWGSDCEKNVPLKAYGGKSGRELMMSLGTGWGQGMVSKTLWTDLLMGAIARDQPRVAIVSDVRFQHEIDALRAAGALIIHVRRTREGRLARLKRKLFAHRSEKGLTPLPHELILTNYNSLTHFMISVNHAIQRISEGSGQGLDVETIGKTYRAEYGPKQ